MAVLPTTPIRTLDDLTRFEAELPLAQRLPERSVLDVFTAAAAAAPERVAITQITTGAPDEVPREVTFAALLGMVRGAANLFTALAGPNPVVAYLLPNLIETHAVLWGAEVAGTAVPVNFLLQPEHIEGLLRASEAKILVALGAHPQLDIWQKAVALRERLPGLVLVRVVPPGTPSLEGVVDLPAALREQPADRLTFGEPRGGDDVAAWFHTGGTTGVPKLVAHTHRGQLVAALGGVALGDMRATDTLTATLPLFHVGGTIFCALAPFLARTRLLILSPGGLRNPAMVSGFWRLVAQHRATLVGAVPTGVGAVLETPVGDADISCVRAGFCGAASLPPAVRERFRQVTGRGLFEVYGMTEASGLIAVDPVAGSGGPGSVGWPLPYTRVVVQRLEAGGGRGPECGVDEVGVVTVRGPTVSPGYRNPAHGAGVFEDGVLDSGDLGYRGADGRLHIAGRAKDLIIRSGHNIDPLMIENAMAAHPAVALAAAVGMPDAYAGELPVCYVVPRPGAAVDVDALHAHAQETIGERPAWPRHIHMVEQIPLTTVGKIYKPALRVDAARRMVAGLVAHGHGIAGATVEAQEGGKRGMLVRITLPAAAAAQADALRAALEGYLFESDVRVGG